MCINAGWWNNKWNEICQLLWTLWTTPPSFIGLNMHSVCHTWVHSYIGSSSVKIYSSSSSCDTSFTGVLQGSVLGSLLFVTFVLFISPVVQMLLPYWAYSWQSELQWNYILSPIRWRHSAVYRCKFLDNCSSNSFNRVVHQEISRLALEQWSDLNPSMSEVIPFYNPTRSKLQVAFAESVPFIKVEGSLIKLEIYDHLQRVFT